MTDTSTHESPDHLVAEALLDIATHLAASSEVIAALHCGWPIDPDKRRAHVAAQQHIARHAPKLHAAWASTLQTYLGMFAVAELDVDARERPTAAHHEAAQVTRMLGASVSAMLMHAAALQRGEPSEYGPDDNAGSKWLTEKHEPICVAILVEVTRLQHQHGAAALGRTDARVLN